MGILINPVSVPLLYESVTVTWYMYELIKSEFIFTPVFLVTIPFEDISNASGLISFRVKEGVKADGTQINFIIQ